MKSLDWVALYSGYLWVFSVETLGWGCHPKSDHQQHLRLFFLNIPVFTNGFFHPSWLAGFLHQIFVRMRRGISEGMSGPTPQLQIGKV